MLEAAKTITHRSKAVRLSGRHHIDWPFLKAVSAL